MELFNKLNFSLNCDHPEFFVASQWQHDKKTPNVKYLIYRWIVATYFSFVVILSIFTADDCKQLPFYLIYLTNWNVLLNGLQSIMATYFVTRYYRKSINFDNDLNSMTAAFKVFWLISSVSVVIATSLSCVYWPIIYTGRDKGLNDSLTHAGNAIILLIDLFIHAHPPRFSHVIYPFTFGIIYVLFSIIYTILGGTDRDYQHFIYSVIDWLQKTGDACIFAIIILLFLSAMHLLLTALIKLRIFIYQRVSSMSQQQNVICSENFAFEA